MWFLVAKRSKGFSAGSSKKGVSIEIRGSKELRDAFFERSDFSGVHTVVLKNAKEIQRQAKENAPVDTGYMKNWIRVSNQRNLQRTIRSNAKYSGFVEHGTVNQNAQPFMKPALSQYKEQFISEVISEIFRKV